MRIHESTKADGALSPVLITFVDGEVVVESEGAALPLPDGALARVMARYGAPVEEGTAFTEVDRLELGGDARIRHVRHLARFDVIAKDWLVYEAPGEEPLCALANTVAGALVHLARAGARAGARPAPSTPDTGS